MELQLRAARMRRMEVLANGPLRGQGGGHSEHDSATLSERSNPNKDMSQALAHGFGKQACEDNQGVAVIRESPPIIK